LGGGGVFGGGGFGGVGVEGVYTDRIDETREDTPLVKLLKEKRGERKVRKLAESGGVKFRGRQTYGLKEVNLDWGVDRNKSSGGRGNSVSRQK